jgi:RNA polymerase sigma-70 factor (ECF subfamily)
VIYGNASVDGGPASVGQRYSANRTLGESVVDLTELVRERYQLASAVHGDVGVPLDAFEDHVRCISRRYLGPSITEDSLAAFITSLHTNDLLLSLSCAMGTNAGWQRFYNVYRKYLSDLSRHLLGRSPDLEGLGETIWIDLFLPDKSGQSRIASYDGRSSLATWLRVVVSNRVINERQRRSLAVGSIDVIPEPADPGAQQTVEARVVRERYRAMIISAFKRSLCVLGDREALIVLMRYDQGLQLGEIARLFSVHQSTITRQLDRVVERLLIDVRDFLSSQYGLNPAQIDECLSVASDTFSTSVSILGLLKERIPREASHIQGSTC